MRLQSALFFLFSLFFFVLFCFVYAPALCSVFPLAEVDDEVIGAHYDITDDDSAVKLSSSLSGPSRSSSL